MNATKKLAALVVACIMVAAVGVPIVYGKDAAVEAGVSGKSPVINSITFSGDEVTDTSVSLTPGPSATTTTPVTITAVIYCKNGPSAIEEVTADISPVIAGYSEAITMTEESTDPSAHTADYTTTINIPSNTAPDDYTVTVTATHHTAGVDPGSGSEDLTVLATLAINDLESVNFGADLVPGGAASEQTVQVTNWGNVDITIGIEPGALSHDDDTIPADYITTTWNSGTSIAVDNGASVTVMLAVPEGTPAGTYTGTITFTPAEAA
jgi:hypothetical protein